MTSCTNDQIGQSACGGAFTSVAPSTAAAGLRTTESSYQASNDPGMTPNQPLATSLHPGNPTPPSESRSPVLRGFNTVDTIDPQPAKPNPLTEQKYPEPSEIAGRTVNQPALTTLHSRINTEAYR